MCLRGRRINPKLMIMLFSLKKHLKLTQFGVSQTANLRWLYLNRILRDLTNKLVYFFLPIFLFQFGQQHIASLANLDGFKAGFLMIIIFFFIVRPVNALLIIPFSRFVFRIGHRRVLAYSYFFRALGYAFLYLSVDQPIFVILAAILDGVQSALFWPSYQTILSKQSHAETMGKNLGLLQFFLQLIGALAPALAGLVVLYFGFDTLFLIGVLVSLANLITVLMLDLPQERDKIGLKEFISWAKERRYIKFALAIGSRYVSEVVLFLWPLYLFILLKNIEKVGYLHSVSLFLSMMLTIFLTFKIDKIKSNKLFKFSGAFLSVIWLIRLNLVSVWGIALIDALDRLISNFHWLFFDVTLYKRSKGSQAFSFFVYSELIQHSIMSFVWLLAGILFLSSSIWTALFIIAAITTILTTLMQSKYS